MVNVITEDADYFAALKPRLFMEAIEKNSYHILEESEEINKILVWAKDVIDAIHSYTKDEKLIPYAHQYAYQAIFKVLEDKGYEVFGEASEWCFYAIQEELKKIDIELFINKLKGYVHSRMIRQSDFDDVLEEFGGIKEFALKSFIDEIKIFDHFYVIDDDWLIVTDMNLCTDRFSSDHIFHKAVKLIDG